MIADVAHLPPGPETAPLFQVLRWLRQPLPFLDECAARHGDAFTIRLAAAPPLVLFSHPREVREILGHDGDRLRAGEANAALAPVLGPRSLLLLDGPHHREVRRLVMPSLHGESLAACAATMGAVADRAIDGWPVGRAFSLHAAMQEVALEVILRTIFGDDEDRELRATVQELLALLAKPFVRVPWRRVDRRMPRRWRRLIETRARLDDALVARIADRRATATSRGDLLDLLLQARGEDRQPLAESELLDQLVTLIVAGHETTATALAWTFHHVLGRPTVLDRLQSEARSATSGQPARTPYCDATVDETLRLQPVFAVIGRRLNEPTTIGGFDLPAGCIAAPCIYLIHRRPDVWDRPAEFDPERFLRKTPSPYEFLPFGGGSRRCLGMAFALFEMRIVLARVLARTRLRPAPGAEVACVRRSITFAPAGGVAAILEARVD